MNTTYDFRNEVQELNGAELQHLQKLLSDPVVIKFLRNRILYLTLDIALSKPDPNQTDMAFRVSMMHDQAYIRAYNDLLSEIPTVIPMIQKENDDGRSTSTE